MSSIFTRIIDGEIPARFVHQDDRCVAFLDVQPLHPGHALVVPRDQIDHWTDLPTDLAAHLMTVAHEIGAAQRESFACRRVGLVIAGFEVPHAHLHVIPVDGMADFDFAARPPAPPAVELDAAQERLCSAIKARANRT